MIRQTALPRLAREGFVPAAPEKRAPMAGGPLRRLADL
jgi:hypothetical protein